MNAALAISRAARVAGIQTYYPQSALEGFGAALASKLGIDVQFTTGQPRTDGQTVYLPQIAGALDEQGFQALCGVAVHEAAHVYFNSVPRYSRYARGDALRAACCNAVLDVADETRVEYVLPSAGRLLVRSNYDAAEKIARSGAILNGDPVWTVLVAGILWSRIGRGPFYRQARGSPHWPLMLKAYGILKRAKTRRPGGRGRFHHQRRTPQWRALSGLADQLVDLLKQLPAPPTQPQFGPAGSDSADQAALSSSAPAGSAEAGYAEGAALCEPPAPGGPSSPGSGGEGGDQHNGFDEGLYRSLKPALVCAVDQLARWDEADGPEGGHASGPRIGRSIERALIDGRCFDRRNTEGEALSAAAILDCSGSMHRVLPRVAAVAQAFAEALSGPAQRVDLCAFGRSPAAVRNFRGVGDMGGTATHEALVWAMARLCDQTGRRVCIVVTDGQPDRSEWTADACRRLVSRGIEVVAIAYDYDPGPLLATLPGARVIAAADPTTLACQLARVAQEVAR